MEKAQRVPFPTYWSNVLQTQPLIYPSDYPPINPWQSCRLSILPGYLFLKLVPNAAGKVSPPPHRCSVWSVRSKLARCTALTPSQPCDCNGVVGGGTVVPTNEHIPIPCPELAVDVLGCPLERDVHVAVDGGEFTCDGIPVSALSPSSPSSPPLSPASGHLHHRR